jgi:glycosyltransferase involved in cell wall biosynthesis
MIMRIAIVPYPTLFQRDAALQTQVRETLRALAALRRYQNRELTVVPFEARPEQLEQYDAVHVFSAAGANQRWIDMAAAMRVPLVLSPLVAPGWSARRGHDDADHAALQRAIGQAALLVAMGKHEKRIIESGFALAPAPIRIMGTGVSALQFDVDGELFRLRTGMRGPFVLMAGPVSPHQQQLALARALTARGVPVVMLGDANGRDQDYCRQVQAVAGVTCLGGLGHDPNMLASACAAASVLVLAGQGDSSVRAVLDTLAAGTPVVLCSVSPIDVPDDCAELRHVLAGDAGARERAVLDLLAAPPPRERVRSRVRSLTWERAALQLAGCYRSVAHCGAPLAA